MGEERPTGRRVKDSRRWIVAAKGIASPCFIPVPRAIPRRATRTTMHLGQPIKGIFSFERTSPFQEPPGRHYSRQRTSCSRPRGLHYLLNYQITHLPIPTEITF